ncbi:annexin B9-like isoform X1 [Melanaphis sacchari]|uniref:annexin B9-like isoform X1 n=1 Tax=Melanaphis sacchari TaxID=742174 RepID=UPI000DC12E5D|nr:annexin B9-like isoform X1 [Melanaphis sacchari]
MSYPGYPPNNQGFPGQPGVQQPGSQLPYPPYPGGNVGQQGFPMPSAYPPGQPSYPQQSPYPPQVGQYPPQPSGQFLPQSGPYTSNLPMYPSSAVGGQYPSTVPGQYPSSTNPGQYPPQASPYPNAQLTSSYVPQSAAYPTQSAYPPTQQTSSVYPNMTAGGYDGGSQGLPQAAYPPISTPAHYQPLSSSPAQKKSNPTLRPANPFDPRRDAEILRKAMKGFGTDEKSIIQVLAHRVNTQRQEIAVQFKTMYGKDLISDLKSEVSGKFKDLIVGLMTPTFDFLAKEIHNAIDGIGTNEETIIEIICTASNAEINNIKMAYHKLFGKDLEKELMGETSGSFRRLLVSLCQGQRNENTFVDVASAQADAQKLLQAGELQFGTDESTFNMILCSRSFCQLQQIFLEYHRLTGRDFEDVIKSEFSGDIENGLKAIVKSVRDKSAYFAKRLHESMAGFGTNDSALIRIVATRCEIDMVDIKNAYMSMYGKSLETDVASDTFMDDTSGDYKKCLIALIVG